MTQCGHIVVDTNIFVDASNAASKRHTEASTFVRQLLPRGDVHLAIDPGFSLNEAQNQSRLGREYLQHVRPQTLGYVTLVKLLTSRRVVATTDHVEQRVKKCIESLISGKKPVDRTLLRVARNTVCRTAISHDEEDFPEWKRPRIRKEVDVRVLSAGEWTLPDMPAEPA